MDNVSLPFERLGHELEKFVKITERVRKNLLDIIQDKHLSLDSRWDIYLKYGKEFLPIDSYYFEPEGIDWNKYTLFDNFYCDKYATMTVDSMTEQIEQNGFEVDWIKYKESWLQKGIWGFMNDR